MATDPPTDNTPPAGDPAHGIGGTPAAEPGRPASDAAREFVMPDGAITRAFLAAIGRADDTILFRALMDDPGLKKVTPPQTFTGTFGELESRLRSASGSGRGIHYQPNLGDGTGGKAANIVGATCFFVDFDGAPLSNADRLGLAPHVRVETSPGRCHFYWRVEGIPIDQWTAIQKRLIALTASDPSLADLAHLMRLPGFLHMKNQSAPYLTTIVVNEAPPYDFVTFVVAIEAAEKAHGIVAEAPRKRLPKTIAPPIDRDLARNLAVAESALRHSIANETLDLAERSEWIRVGIALKATFGDAGFALWVRLSSEAEGFDGEEDCRKQWETVKGDLPADKQLTIATFIQNAKYSGWKHPGGGGDGSGGGNGGGGNGGGGGPDGSPDGGGEPVGGGGRGKPDAASVVLEQADEAGDERFLDKDGVAYVRFRRKAGDADATWITARIDSERYQGMLRRRFHMEAVNKTLPKEQLASAIALLKAEAVERDERRLVHLRVGAHDGRVYVDISGDGTLVYEVDGEGWRPIADSPVLFLAGSRSALPVPEPGGTLADLQEQMPNLDEGGVQRALAFAIGTFNTEGTFPMLLLGGGHGTNKSTAADMIVALADPPAGRQDARFTFSADDRDLVIHAQHAHVLFFDNVSSFGSRESDRLCKLMSGTAFATRTLHTNSEEQRFAMRRPVIATCIGMPTTRGDLLDRTIPVVAEHNGKRRTEAAVWAAFGKAWPKLFGLVLTGVSQALRNRAAVQAKVDNEEIKPPRLMDFAQFVEGAYEVLELAPGAFCDMLRGEQSTLQAEAAAGDPLGAALVARFSIPDITPIDASAVELLSLLSTGSRERERGWPSKFKVSSHLERLKPGLLDLGIKVETVKAKGKANVARFKISVTKDFDPTSDPGEQAF